MFNAYYRSRYADQLGYLVLIDILETSSARTLCGAGGLGLYDKYNIVIHFFLHLSFEKRLTLSLAMPLNTSITSPIS